MSLLVSTVFRFFMLFEISRDWGMLVQKILIGCSSRKTGFSGFSPIGLNVSRTFS